MLSPNRGACRGARFVIASLQDLAAANFSGAQRSTCSKSTRRSYGTIRSAAAGPRAYYACPFLTLPTKSLRVPVWQRISARDNALDCKRSVASVAAPREVAGSEPGINIQNEDAWPEWRKKTVKVCPAPVWLSPFLTFPLYGLLIQILVPNNSCRFFSRSY